MGIFKIYILTALCLWQQTEPSSYIQGNNFEGYIFNKEFFILLTIKNQKVRYTPNSEDITNAEQIISQKLYRINRKRINQASPCPIIHENLKNYERQYFGFINRRGEKIIWINYIIKDYVTKEMLAKDLILPKDGCSNFWNVKVNLNLGKIFDLHINGPG